MNLWRGVLIELVWRPEDLAYSPELWRLVSRRIIVAAVDSSVGVTIEVGAGKRLVPSQAKLLHLEIVVLDDDHVCRLWMVLRLKGHVLQWHRILLVKLGQELLPPGQPVKGAAHLGELGELLQTQAVGDDNHDREVTIQLTSPLLHLRLHQLG